ncbi:RILP-like protein 1 isoform X5 [Branchiostoma lanceolatum]|uniref:RILP-like protein 1 isoform X5 n=1 Tax=Branchiostoma lanceolatum TaxID=7740 RepID=UPI003454DDFD
MAEEEHSSIPLELTVVDVYKWAAEIGQEFERLIDTFGTESVSDFMPKVVRVLEQLEKLVDRDEKEHNEVSELRLDVQRLQAMYLEKSEQNARIQKDLEQVDESWKEEAKELLQTISRLREENKQLNTALSSHTTEQHAHAKEISDSDFEVMTRLKETVDRQRDALRAKDMEINQRNMELEALQSQVERLAKVNHDLRRKQAITQQQGKSLVEEKAHLQASLQGKEQEITALKDRLGLQGDLGDQIIKEMMDSLEVLQTEERDDNSRGKEESSDMAQLDDTTRLDGKLVIDLSDPERPRFTMTELRSVLQEKNELKIRLMEVEDELSKYKNEDETDAPVPDLPEPTAQQPQQESGIKKLFSFFSRSKTSPPSPSSSHQPSPSPLPDVSESDNSASEDQQQPHSTETPPVPADYPTVTDETAPVATETKPVATETTPTQPSETSDQAAKKNSHSKEHQDNDQEVDKAEEASETDGKVPEMLLCSGV